ncbi:MAG: imidazole glycerol phosphate synthase subunit HisH [Nitrospiraceae bacterium]|nr:imidazole glycerol phosphate synthase subunit HisH [Nitrospiraceae bacterium]
MIAIVDYGMGNLRSVEKGFQKVNVDARIVSDAKSIDDADGVVLPGVGAFIDCIKNLTDMNLTDAIIKSISKGKPYLGICLGLQVLFTESEEFGTCKGLNVLKGRVVRFPKNKLKVPHMGWNTVDIKKNSPIFSGIPEKSYFYFVHSFYVVPDDESVISGTTDYGTSFTSMIWKDNVLATQFHPEKSQELGLKILKGFGDFVKKEIAF